MLILKVKRADSEKQLTDLTEKLEELMQEKQDLQIKERILQDRLHHAQGHLEELFGNKVKSPISLSISSSENHTLTATKRKQSVRLVVA